MKTIIASIVTFMTVLFVGGVSYAQPHYTEIGITGSTNWGTEYHQALVLARAYGAPVQDGCSTTSLCVTLSHYSAADRTAGYAMVGGNNPIIRLNDHYDTGQSTRRLMLFLHEIGHVAGLEHSDCGSSMAASIPSCGHYYIGYNGAEQAELRRIWG